MARSLRVIIHRSNVKERLKSVMTMLAKLRHISHEPQHSLPDVFLWLLQNNKRVAYHRVPAKQLIYSPNEEEAGKDCGTVQTLFLKVLVKTRKPSLEVAPTTLATLDDHEFSVGRYLFMVSNSGVLFCYSAVTGFPHFAFQSVDCNGTELCHHVTLNFDLRH